MPNQTNQSKVWLAIAVLFVLLFVLFVSNAAKAADRPVMYNLELKCENIRHMGDKRRGYTELILQQAFYNSMLLFDPDEVWFIKSVMFGSQERSDRTVMELLRECGKNPDIVIHSMLEIMIAERIVNPTGSTQ